MATPILGDEEFEVVLGAAQGGKSWAFERLFHLVAQPILAYFRAQGSSDPDALTNETLLRAFREVGSFSGDADGFRAWTFTIARCRLIDERRARARRPQTEPLTDDAGVARLVPRGGDAEADAIASLGDDWVRETLDALAPDQRDVLVLRFVADLSIDQTAEVLGKTPGAVKALQHRGIAAIRRSSAAETVSI
ncbi:MAG TPA: RNA polymerase sigma factor [Acidimicrobiia bacterium]|nr:RNA polymerase sigma factor [Acidimicrobiia bacterium]